MNEIHSSGTKKNKEWQEKLPLVVLRAEEIMYSKANSEAEYMDLKTLAERANDAIDTIIRRDETTETGQLLPPCVEAALNLGCIPRRASRSQRNNSPRCYLPSSTQGPGESSFAPKAAENNSSLHLRPSHLSNLNPNSSLQFAPYHPALVTATKYGSCLAIDSRHPAHQEKPMPHETMSLLPMAHSDTYHFAETFSLTWQDSSILPKETYPSMSFGHNCPIYYSKNPMEAGFVFQYPDVPNRDAFFVGKPHVPAVVDGTLGSFQNLLSRGSSLNTSERLIHTSSDFGSTSGNPADMGYDLSLRLGPLSTPCLSREKGWVLKDTDSTGPHERSRFCDQSLSRVMGSHFYYSSSSAQISKGFSFFPLDTMDEPLGPCSSK